MCDQTQVEYKPGDVVWFKISSVWWPAQVQDQSGLDDEVTRGLKKKPFAVVKFFNEDLYEFVKDINQICHYNSNRKYEFIKKGMDAYRTLGEKNKMNKFPGDVILAEEFTGGNVKILEDPRLAPEEKINYKDLFTTPKRIDKNSKTKSKHSLTKSKLSPGATFSPFSIRQDYARSSNKNYFSKDLVQKECELNGAEFKCDACDFVCSRISTLTAHKAFNKQNSCTNKAPIKFNKAVSSAKFEKSPIKRKSLASEDSIKKKPKISLKGVTPESKKVTKVKSLMKESKEREKKKSEAMREQLLRDWNEEDAEDSDTAETLLTIVESKAQDSDKSIDSKADGNDKSFETSVGGTDKSVDNKVEGVNESIGSKAETPDKSIGSKAEGNDKSFGSKSESNDKSNTTTKAEDPNKSSNDLIKKTSCFDFEDNDEEDINVNPTIRFGQKLPRIIAKDDKSKNKDTKYKDNKSTNDDDDALEKEFNDIMKETSVPVVPMMTDSFLLDSSALPADVDAGKAEENLGSVCDDALKKDCKLEIPSDKDVPSESGDPDRCIQTIERIIDDEDNSSLLRTLESDSAAEDEALSGKSTFQPIKRSLSSLCEEPNKRLKSDIDLKKELCRDSSENNNSLPAGKVIDVNGQSKAISVDKLCDNKSTQQVVMVKGSVVETSQSPEVKRGDVCKPKGSTSKKQSRHSVRRKSSSDQPPSSSAGQIKSEQQNKSMKNVQLSEEAEIDASAKPTHGKVGKVRPKSMMKGKAGMDKGKKKSDDKRKSNQKDSKKIKVPEINNEFIKSEVDICNVAVVNSNQPVKNDENRPSSLLKNLKGKNKDTKKSKDSDNFKSMSKQFRSVTSSKNNRKDDKPSKSVDAKLNRKESHNVDDLSEDADQSNSLSHLQDLTSNKSPTTVAESSSQKKLSRESLKNESSRERSLTKKSKFNKLLDPSTPKKQSSSADIDSTTSTPQPSVKSTSPKNRRKSSSKTRSQSHQVDKSSSRKLVEEPVTPKLADDSPRLSHGDGPKASCKSLLSPKKLSANETSSTPSVAVEVVKSSNDLISSESLSSDLKLSDVKSPKKQSIISSSEKQLVGLKLSNDLKFPEKLTVNQSSPRKSSPGLRSPEKTVSDLKHSEKASRREKTAERLSNNLKSPEKVSSSNRSPEKPTVVKSSDPRPPDHLPDNLGLTEKASSHRRSSEKLSTDVKLPEKVPSIIWSPGKSSLTVKSHEKNAGLSSPDQLICDERHVEKATSHQISSEKVSSSNRSSGKSPTKSEKLIGLRSPDQLPDDSRAVEKPLNYQKSPEKLSDLKMSANSNRSPRKLEFVKSEKALCLKSPDRLADDLRPMETMSAGSRSSDEKSHEKKSVRHSSPTKSTCDFQSSKKSSITLGSPEKSSVVSKSLNKPSDVPKSVEEASILKVDKSKCAEVKFTSPCEMKTSHPSDKSSSKSKSDSQILLSPDKSSNKPLVKIGLTEKSSFPKSEKLDDSTLSEETSVDLDRLSDKYSANQIEIVKGSPSQEKSPKTIKSHLEKSISKDKRDSRARSSERHSSKDSRSSKADRISKHHHRGSTSRSHSSSSSSSSSKKDRSSHMESSSSKKDRISHKDKKEDKYKSRKERDYDKHRKRHDSKSEKKRESSRSDSSSSHPKKHEKKRADDAETTKSCQRPALPSEDKTGENNSTIIGSTDSLTNISKAVDTTLRKEDAVSPIQGNEKLEDVSTNISVLVPSTITTENITLAQIAPVDVPCPHPKELEVKIPEITCSKDPTSQEMEEKENGRSADSIASVVTHEIETKTTVKDETGVVDQNEVPSQEIVDVKQPFVVNDSSAQEAMEYKEIQQVVCSVDALPVASEIMSETQKQIVDTALSVSINETVDSKRIVDQNSETLVADLKPRSNESEVEQVCESNTAVLEETTVNVEVLQPTCDKDGENDLLISKPVTDSKHGESDTVDAPVASGDMESATCNELSVDSENVPSRALVTDKVELKLNSEETLGLKENENISINTDKDGDSINKTVITEQIIDGTDSASVETEKIQEDNRDNEVSEMVVECVINDTDLSMEASSVKPPEDSSLVSVTESVCSTEIVGEQLKLDVCSSDNKPEFDSVCSEVEKSDVKLTIEPDNSMNDVQTFTTSEVADSRPELESNSALENISNEPEIASSLPLIETSVIKKPDESVTVNTEASASISQVEDKSDQNIPLNDDNNSESLGSDLFNSKLGVASEVVISSEPDDKVNDTGTNIASAPPKPDIIKTPVSFQSIGPKSVLIRCKTSPFGELKLNLSQPMNLPSDYALNFQTKAISADFLTPDKIKEIFKKEEDGTCTTSTQNSSIIRPIVVPPQAMLEEDSGPRVIVESISSTTVSSEFTPSTSSLPTNTALSQGFVTTDVQNMELDINSMPIVIADAPEMVSSVSSVESTSAVPIVLKSIIPSSLSLPFTSVSSVCTPLPLPAPPVIQAEKPQLKCAFIKLVKPNTIKPGPGYRILQVPAKVKPHFGRIITHHDLLNVKHLSSHLLQKNTFSGKLMSDSIISHKKDGGRIFIVSNSSNKRFVIKSDGKARAAQLNHIITRKGNANISPKDLIVTIPNSEAGTSGKMKQGSDMNFAPTRKIQILQKRVILTNKNQTVQVSNAKPIDMLTQKKLIGICKAPDAPETSPKKVVRFKEPEIVKPARTSSIVCSRRRPNLIKQNIVSNSSSGVETSGQQSSSNNTCPQEPRVIGIGDTGEANKNKPLISVSNISVKPQTSGKNVVVPVPLQDILAKALADTQVLQSDIDTPVEPSPPTTFVQQSMIGGVGSNIATTVTIGRTVMSPAEVPGRGLSNYNLGTVYTTPAVIVQPSMPLLSDEMDCRQGVVVSTVEPSSAFQLGCSQVIMTPATLTEPNAPSVFSQTSIVRSGCDVESVSTTQLTANIDLAEIELPPGHPPDSTECHVPDISSIPLPPEPYTGNRTVTSSDTLTDMPKQFDSLSLSQYHSNSTNTISSTFQSPATSEERHLTSLYQGVGNS